MLMRITPEAVCSPVSGRSHPLLGHWCLTCQRAQERPVSCSRTSRHVSDVQNTDFTTPQYGENNSTFWQPGRRRGRKNIQDPRVKNVNRHRFLFVNHLGVRCWHYRSLQFVVHLSIPVHILLRWALLPKDPLPSCPVTLLKLYFSCFLHPVSRVLQTSTQNSVQSTPAPIKWGSGLLW